MTTIRSISMSIDAAALAESVGVSPTRDARRLRDSEISAAELLDECLWQCEDEADRALWAEYVAAVVAAVS